MWQNEPFGGGFNTNFETPGGGGGQSEKKTYKRPQSIVPVTVKQILDSPESGLTIGGIDVQLVTLLGILKSVEVSSVKITYVLEDDTGSITGTFWLDGDQDSSNTPASIPVVENIHCSMTGSIKNQGGKRQLLAFNIRAVTDPNEITAHLLAVINIALKADQMAKQVTEEPANQQALMNNLGLSAQQQRVCRAIEAMQGRSESGADAHDILNAMTVKMPIQDIEKILEFLVQEGHIYSTIDDYHFMLTDSHAFED